MLTNMGTLSICDGPQRAALAAVLPINSYVFYDSAPIERRIDQQERWTRHGPWLWV